MFYNILKKLVYHSIRNYICIIINQINESMTDKMKTYLASLTRKDAIDFFREEKDRDKYLAESKEFYEALWDRFLELLKQES